MKSCGALALEPAAGLLQGYTLPSGKVWEAEQVQAHGGGSVGGLCVLHVGGDGGDGGDDGGVRQWASLGLCPMGLSDYGKERD